jgi:hypothetical protein
LPSQLSAYAQPLQAGVSDPGYNNWRPSTKPDGM